MSYKEVDPDEAKQMMESNSDLFLLDVREQHEYDRAQ